MGEQQSEAAGPGKYICNHHFSLHVPVGINDTHAKALPMLTAPGQAVTRKVSKSGQGWEMSHVHEHLSIPLQRSCAITSAVNPKLCAKPQRMPLFFTSLRKARKH
jgi:hypothetical protein